MTSGGRALRADEVRWVAGPVAKSRREPRPSQLLGQPRALDALRTGLDLYAPGYNVFLSGLSGSGRTRVVRDLLEELMPACRLGPDRAFVHNFNEPNRPVLLTLPRGTARRFRAEMVDLVHELRIGLRDALGSRAHRSARKLVRGHAEERHQRLLAALRREVRRHDCDVVEFQEEGAVRAEILPRVEGQPVSLEEFEGLRRKGGIAESVARRVLRAREQMLERLEEMSEHLRRTWQRFEAELREMDAALATRTATAVLDAFGARWPHDGVGAHLEALRADLVANLGRWIEGDVSRTGGEDGVVVRALDGRFRDLEVLVVKSHAGEDCPVVVESSPNYANLFGIIERIVDAEDSELRRIHSGALLRADGGYLILRCSDVLTEPGVWQHLKRALKAGSVEIREFDPSAGTTAGALQPEPIPIDVKVVMIGEPGLYEHLCQEDPQFPQLFKVYAEFDGALPNTATNRRRYADFIAHLARSEGLLPFEAEAHGVACEHGARTAGRKDRLSTQFGELADVAREAAHRARRAGARAVSAADVRAAIDARERRLDLAREHVEADYRDGYTLLRCKGRAVGLIHALTVLDSGTFRFGRVVRISAATGPSSDRKAEVISIEREADMTGPLHDKGVMIFQGFLLDRLGREGPIGMSATLCFEQLYTGLDGDSATCAELYALLSSLTRVPLRQGIAVTGSMNQRGEVQAVGGVTEKVEGFFRLCSAKGLDGEQGVVLPAANVRDLMLAPEVAAAVAAGRFHVWAMKDVFEGFERLSGLSMRETLSRCREALQAFRRLSEDERGGEEVESHRRGGA
ncbi:MAG: ATP-dependent Lon protease [Planctomycetota bacterium]